MLPKVVMSWVGRLVGIAAVLSSPLVARAAETTDAPATTKQVRHASPSHEHAKKKTLKRGTRHEAEVAKNEKSDKRETTPAKGDAPHAKPARATKVEATKGDDTDVTDVTEQVMAERASTKPPPKPSKTPLPTIGAAATAPRANLPESCPAPAEPKGEDARREDPREGARRKGAPREGARREGPRRRAAHTPIVRASFRGTRSCPVDQKAKHAKPPCLHAAGLVTRGEEEETRADQVRRERAPLAIEEMSVLARPGSAAKPTSRIAELAAKAARRTPMSSPPGSSDRRTPRRTHAAVINHFAKPGDVPKMFVVSGYRPTSKGSFHATGRAIDFRIEGVENTDLVAYCKTLDEPAAGTTRTARSSTWTSATPAPATSRGSTPAAPARSPSTSSPWPPPPKPEEQDPVKILARLDELQVLPMEEARDTKNAKSDEDSKDDDADSEPGVLLKPIIDENRKAGSKGE